MKRSEKAQVVERLSRRVGEAKCLYLADFTGLDVASMTELRARLSGAEVDLVVVKNTLARKALEDGPYADLSDHLVGPNAFAMSNVDVVSPAKILTEFAREREKPSIKAGAIEGRVVSIDEIRRIAELPPREELLAQLVGYAKAPMAGLVYTLDALLAKLVRTLEAVRAKKEEQGEGGEAAPDVEVEEPVAEADEAPAVAEAELEAEAEAGEPEPEETKAEAEEAEVEEAEEPEVEAEVEEPEAEESEKEPAAEEEPEEELAAEEPEEEPEAPRAATEEPEEGTEEEGAEEADEKKES